MTVLLATLALAGIGAAAALALALADRFLSVREDPRIGMVTAALPGDFTVLGLNNRAAVSILENTFFPSFEDSFPCLYKSSLVFEM